jgi:starch phosphorylase
MPSLDRYRSLIDDGFADAKSLASWRRDIEEEWSQIRAESVESGISGELHVGQDFTAQATVYLNDLTPDDVCVELYVGLVNPSGEIVQGDPVRMAVKQELEDGRYLYEAEAECGMSGLHGYTVRILPCHPDLVTHFQPGYIRWAG